MRKNLDVTKRRYSEQFCQSLGPLLNRGSTVTNVIYYYWGKENPSLYRGLRYVEVRYIEVSL